MTKVKREFWNKKFVTVLHKASDMIFLSKANSNDKVTQNQPFQIIMVKYIKYYKIIYSIKNQ